jgi:hypothetical protein
MYAAPLTTIAVEGHERRDLVADQRQLADVAPEGNTRHSHPNTLQTSADLTRRLAYARTI